jgi:hypothetical protein
MRSSGTSPASLILISNTTGPFTPDRLASAGNAGCTIVTGFAAESVSVIWIPGCRGLGAGADDSGTLLSQAPKKMASSPKNTSGRRESRVGRKFRSIQSIISYPQSKIRWRRLSGIGIRCQSSLRVSVYLRRCGFQSGGFCLFSNKGNGKRQSFDVKCLSAHFLQDLSIRRSRHR